MDSEKYLDQSSNLLKEYISRNNYKSAFNLLLKILININDEKTKTFAKQLISYKNNKDY